MTANEDFLRKYFSPETWSRLTMLRIRDDESLIPTEWLELLRQANRFIGLDLRGEDAQAWADCCHQAWKRWTDGDAEIRAGFGKALTDQRNWPEVARRECEGCNFEAALALIAKAQTYSRMGYGNRWKQIRKDVM